MQQTIEPNLLRILPINKHLQLKLASICPEESDKPTEYGSNLPAFCEELIFQVENDLQLPEGHIKSLWTLPDHDMILQMVTVLENYSLLLLVRHFRDQRLIPFLSNQKSYIRIDLLRTLEIMPAYNCELMRELSQIRNKVGHKVNSPPFNIRTYWDNLSNEKKRAVIAGCGDAVIADVNPLPLLGSITLDKQYEAAYYKSQLTKFQDDPRGFLFWAYIWIVGNLAKSRLIIDLKENRHIV